MPSTKARLKVLFVQAQKLTPFWKASSALSCENEQTHRVQHTYRMEETRGPRKNLQQSGL